MRVDDDIRCETICGERHVFLAIGDTDGTLLSVTRGKLVTDLRYLSRSCSNLDEP